MTLTDDDKIALRKRLADLKRTHALLKKYLNLVDEDMLKTTIRLTSNEYNAEDWK